MFFMEYEYGKTQSIWAETAEQWDEIHPSWKIVGQSPRRICKSMVRPNSPTTDLTRQSIEHIFVQKDCYYRVVFSSNRECIGVSRHSIQSGTYVIIEADRGEDCAMVAEQIECKFNNGKPDNLKQGCFGFHMQISPNKSENQIKSEIKHNNLEIKNIIRFAIEKDVEIIDQRKKQEAKALEKCKALAAEYGYSMEITRCEFQWDMKKITFYFRSARRIDFRELVKALFKYFKIRIWLSMENRSCL